MPTTYTLISSTTLGSNAASVSFSSIPNTYTDLVLKISGRDTGSGTRNPIVVFNGTSTSIYSYVYGLSDGTGYTSATASPAPYLLMWYGTAGATETTNTFSNFEMYIFNYSSTTLNKPISTYSVIPSNNLATIAAFQCGLFNSTDAISSMVMNANATFLAGSTFSLYGIKNS